MADQKPPRFAGDEHATLRALLNYHRESLVRKLDGLDDATAGRHLVESDTTLLWLVKHAAGTVASVIDSYRATWVRVDTILDAASLEDRRPPLSGDGEVNVRWVWTHLLEETARHAGHADILRELIDGQVGR
jgi:hypothetical protein